MNVLMLSPGFPAEMPHYARGLAEVGARVFGVGDQPRPALPKIAAESLYDYLHVRSLWDVQALAAAVRSWLRGRSVDRIVCLWEAGMSCAAELREMFGVPGLNVEQTVRFRDKGVMKQTLEAAGIRTPRHARARTVSECEDAALRIGYPLILKPIAGAGSQDTYRIDDQAALREVLPRLRHVAEISIEEFVEGQEYTFDTVCIGGELAYYNLAWYRPKVLIARSEQWVSPQTVTLREPEQPKLAGGFELGHKVLKALEYSTGFTHMEWFLTPQGEAVFGEIGARPPGGRSVDLMNYACDIDLFKGWAEAECHGRFSQQIQRRYNAAIVFKRARGEGRIQRVEGLRSILARYREHIVCVDLLPIGAPRRDWRQTLLSDGYLIMRHPDLPTTLEMADRVGTDLQIYAG